MTRGMGPGILEDILKVSSLVSHLRRCWHY